MKFIKQGILHDEDMPEVDFYRLLAMGMRDSPVFDISPAFEELGQIKYGIISWFARPKNSSKVKVLVSFDGEKYKELDSRFHIPEVENLNRTPYIWLRCFVISEIATIEREKGPQLFGVTITLLNQEQKTWSKSAPISLKWKGE